MRTNAQAQIESMLDELHTVTMRTTQLKTEIEALLSSARSDDGLVTVTVDARGGLTDLTIHEQALRHRDPLALSDVILRTSRVAIDRAYQRTQSLVSHCLPSTLADLFGADGTMSPLVLSRLGLSVDERRRGR